MAIAMSLDNYTIDTERNSYFNGRDAVLYKNGERVAKIALKDNKPAIYVKVYSWGTDGTKELVADLGEQRVNEVIEGIQHDFWWHYAPECVQENGHYSDVFSSGRSGGWCIPHAENRDNDWHWWDECAIDDPFPEDAESTDDMSSIDARRYWFFQAAEAITAEVEHLRTYWFDEQVREAHEELEHARENAIGRGEN